VNAAAIASSTVAAAHTVHITQQPMPSSGGPVGTLGTAFVRKGPVPASGNCSGRRFQRAPLTPLT
jgi:hypothetical protein